MTPHHGSLDEIGERDHEVTSEYRIFGPPGTGKTTSLSRQIHRAVERFGPDSVLVTSFSRAAAAELAGRDLPVSPDRVGTLHSHCWHVLGGPEIAEANVDEWNRDHPALAITPAKKRGRLDGEDGAADDSETEKRGDELLQQLNRYRGLMMSLPHGAWNEPLSAFENLWTGYKRKNGLFDFTDLIETCLHDVALAPRNPSVIFVDEAQDHNRMQLQLVRKWGERANYFIAAGDDDQTLYQFCGATPEAFLDPEIPADHKIVLKQSYRVPRAVHGFAEALIRRVTRRQPKEYLPRPADGALERFSRDGYLHTEYDILKTATEHLERGHTVMFLASCAYMLRSLVSVLRRNGIPYHNPYRRSNGHWNPLRIGKRTSTSGRILSLLVAHPGFGDGHRPWTNGDVALWAEVLMAQGILRHGVKAKLKNGDAAREATPESLDKIFEPAALESLGAAWEGDYCDLLGWWQERLLGEMRNRAEFPALVASKRGPLALAEEPGVIVGTIHSVKGGQADCSPPDEPVLTTRGYVPIGDLNPALHRLVSYTSHTNKIRRGVVHNAAQRSEEGYPFRKASRSYCGDILTVVTPASRTRVTPNHHLIVRWAESAKANFVTYLMRRRDWWRIGHCRLFYTGGSQFGLAGRTRREGADAAWVLGVHATRAEAAFDEALMASRYGIPMLCFNGNPRGRLKRAELIIIHNRLRGFTQGKAEELLFQRGLDPQYPFYTPTDERGNGRRTGPQNRFVVRACNLVPGVMEIPVLADGARPRWEGIGVDHAHFEGTVFSLEVDPHHYYISGGAVVHNCVYLFPDLSQAGDAQYRRDGAPRDSVIRQFYVGATRAREKLYICARESNMAVSI